MRFYATTLFSLFQSGLIFREICLRRIFTIAEPKTMRAGMSACQHRFSSSLPYEHPPAAAPFFCFRRGGRARSLIVAIDFADTAPSGPADSAEKRARSAG
jgi:hypothetical protein